MGFGKVAPAPFSVGLATSRQRQRETYQQQRDAIDH